MSFEEERKKGGARAYFPVMGFIMAIAVLVMAYFLAPEVIKLLAGLELQGMTERQLYGRLDIAYSPDAETQTANIMNSFAHFAFTGLIFLLIFSILMLIVAIAIGEDPDREAAIIHPREGDIKGAKRYVNEIEKLKKKREKQAKEYERRQKNK